MKNKKGNSPSQRTITGLLVLSIALIAFVAYKDILGYFFTATDTFALIDTSRIQSFKDVVRIFTEPLMNGTAFVEYAKFYRPILILIYSLEYSIWQLNPFGYHLTHLILHISVSAFIFSLLRFLTNGKQFTAWLGAIIFAIHPIIVETVPGNDRREDILAPLLLLFSLYLFLKFFSTEQRRKGFLLLSIFLYALALGTKEITVILPFLIFTYLIIFPFSDETSFKEKMVIAVKACLPYFVVTFVYLAWRTYILQGMGGYTYKPFGVLNIRLIIDILENYPMDLLYPIDFLRPLLNNLIIIFKHTGHFIALFTLLIFLLFYKRIISTLVDQNDMNLMKTLKSILATIIILSLVCILIYPTISPFINLQIQRAYYGEGPRFLSDAMEQRHTFPLEYYFTTAKELILTLFSISMFYSVIFLIGTQHNKLKSIFVNPDSRKLMVFFLIWLSLPFGIFLLTQTFMHNNMYISIIPFSALLSITIVESFNSIILKIREHPFAGSSNRLSLIKSTFFSSVIFIILTGFSISFIAYSPLLRTYRDWEDSGKISSLFFHKLSEIITELPNDAVIHINNIPWRISSYKARIPHVKHIPNLYIHSIESWLNLTYPRNNMKVAIHSWSEPKVYPNNLSLEVKRSEGNKVEINVVFDNSINKTSIRKAN